jgi:hypothetical protein
MIADFCQKLDDWSLEHRRPVIEKEILSAGPILLFTSPRKLLSSAGVVRQQQESEVITSFVDSQESPHHGFLAYESPKATLLFHPKRLNLIDEDLVKLGITHQRIEWKWPGAKEETIEERQGRIAFLKHLPERPISYPYTSIPGFFHTNRSQILFSKLKNKNLAVSDEQLLQGKQELAGHILDVAKGDGLVLLVEHEAGLKLGENLTLINPEGQRVELALIALQDLSRTPKEFIGQGELAFIPYVRKMVAQSIVLKNMEFN